jgi:hypothetical protein
MELLYRPAYEKVFRTVGCDDFSEEACTVENGRGRWEGDEVVWQFTVPKDGKDIPAKKSFGQKRTTARLLTSGTLLMRADFEARLDISVHAGRNRHREVATPDRMINRDCAQNRAMA